MNDKPYKILNKKELAGSKLEIEAEISLESIENFRQASIKDLGIDLEFPGFRKGQATDKMVVQAVGEFKIAEKSTYKALNNIIPMIFAMEKINSLTSPEINVTKITPGSPVQFKMIVEVLPEITLPDYKAIAKEIKSVTEQKVEDKEVDTYIDYIRSQRAQAMALKEKDTKEDKNEKPKLPELDDSFVKSLGDFENVEDFKKKLKENMVKEKEIKEQQKRRLLIMEKIISETKFTPPQALVDQEIERMMGQFKHDIELYKMNIEEYLKEIKKTEEDLKKEWKVDASKKVKMNLILPKIAEVEKLEVNKDAVEKEVEHLKEHHKDINTEHARMYVNNVLKNEEVFKFLENLAKQ